MAASPRHRRLIPIFDHAVGIDELDELCHLFTIAAGHPYDIDNDYAKRMRDERPELGLHTVDNDNEPSKHPLADSISLLLECGYAIVKPDGTPWRGSDVEYRELNPKSAEVAAELVARLKGTDA